MSVSVRPVVQANHTRALLTIKEACIAIDVKPFHFFILL
jgi:hypothetical protein